MEELCPQVKEPWEEVSRLHSIRYEEKGIEQIFSEILQTQYPEIPATLKEGQAESVFIRLGNGDSLDGKGQKLVTSGIRKVAYVPLAGLQLWNMFSALASDEGIGALSNKATKSDEPESCRSTRRKQQVIIVGNSLL